MPFMNILKNITFTAVLFLFFFYAFNFFRCIPVEFSNGEAVTCSLNYVSCFHSQYEDNYPNFLKGAYLMYFVFPIILPVSMTLLVTYLRKKFAS